MNCFHIITEKLHYTKSVKALWGLVVLFMGLSVLVGTLGLQVNPQVQPRKESGAGPSLSAEWQVLLS